MRIFFDSSYFFPSIGVEVEKFPIDFLLTCIDSLTEHNLYYSIITLFELQAKGSKYVINNKMDSNDITNGITAILHNDILIKIPYWSMEITKLAINFRKLHSDFINCLLLATGVIHSDIIITEDNLWKKMISKLNLGISNNVNCFNSSEFIKKFNLN